MNNPLMCTSQGAISFLVRAALVIFLLPTNKIILYQTEAFPGAAGHCESGDLNGKNSGHGELGGGPLSNGQLRVKLDSTALQAFSSTPTVLNANQKYTVTLDFATIDSNFFFRGFLFRLSGANGEDVEGVLSVGTHSNVQSKACASGISGITHTNRDDKNSVTFDFEYTGSVSAELFMEVTVVRQRSQDNWFYSAYNLAIGDDNEVSQEPSSGSVVSTPAPVPVGPTTPAPFPTICADTEGSWAINGSVRAWCFWARKEGEAEIDNRCTLKSLYDDCPVTCNSCPTHAPSQSVSYEPSSGGVVSTPAPMTSTLAPVTHSQNPSEMFSPAPTETVTGMPSHVPTLIHSPQPSIIGTTITTPAPNPSGPSSCNDSPLLFKFKGHLRSCAYIAHKKEKRCAKKNAHLSCPRACGTCDNCKDSTQKFKMTLKSGETKLKTCAALAKKDRPYKWCRLVGVAATCRELCQLCSSSTIF